MIFDGEQWAIRKDTEARNYCGVVPNLVMVYPARSKDYTVYIQVPSDLFNFLKNVLGVTVGEMERSPITFFLEQEKEWWFAVLLPNKDIIDLWSYKDLPPWAMKVV